MLALMSWYPQLYELACQLYSDVDDLGPQSADGSDTAWRSQWHRFVSELASETGLSGRTVRVLCPSVLSAAGVRI